MHLFRFNPQAGSFTPNPEFFEKFPKRSVSCEIGASFPVCAARMGQETAIKKHLDAQLKIAEQMALSIPPPKDEEFMFLPGWGSRIANFVCHKDSVTQEAIDLLERKKNFLRTSWETASLVSAISVQTDSNFSTNYCSDTKMATLKRENKNNEYVKQRSRLESREKQRQKKGILEIMMMKVMKKKMDKIKTALEKEMDG